MTYKQTIEYLFARLPMFQRMGKSAYKDNLDTTLALDEALGHPHRRFKSVHIAGTNGKGSVAHMLAAILQAAGYKTGLYTSPHLKDFRERIRVNGQCITEEAIVSFVAKHKELIESKHLKPSFFELTVAMAFDYFASEATDIAVIETGMGGRLDSTNIITPVLSVITNISLDHTQFLGDTAQQIAAEKAGIIKPHTPVIIGERQPETEDVLIRKAYQQRAPLQFADELYSIDLSLMNPDGTQSMNVLRQGKKYLKDLRLDLAAVYQQKNAITTLASIEALRNQGLLISEEQLRNGLQHAAASTGLQGRWQTIGHNPRVICDTAHNEAGLTLVVQQLNQVPHKRLHVVFGMVSDKEPGKLLRLLPKKAVYYFTQAGIPRAMDRNTLLQEARKAGLRGTDHATPAEALDTARSLANPEDLVFTGGSTFVVAEVLTHLRSG